MVLLKNLLVLLFATSLLTGVLADEYHVRKRLDEKALLRELAEIGPGREVARDEGYLTTTEGTNPWIPLTRDNLHEFPNPFVQAPVPQGRVVGGDSLEDTWLPELVMIDPDEGCHGVLFYEDIVVTTVECAGKIGTVHDNMRIGIKNNFTFTNATGVTVNITYCYESYTPPGYNQMHYKGDVAVIKLDEIATGDARVESFINGDPDIPRWNAIDMDFYGFGLTDPNITFVTDKPVYLQNLTVQYLGTCQRAYLDGFNKTRYDYSAHLCVVYPPKSGPCVGDKGAPLYYCVPDSTAETGQKCVVVGLLSFLIEPDAQNDEPSCTGNLPDVFVRLSTYYTWFYNHLCTTSQNPPKECFDDYQYTDPPCRVPRDRPPAAPAPSPSCACFSEDSTVEVLGKGETRMVDIAIGDKVRTMDSYEPVYAFAHRDSNKSTRYLHIFTENSHDPLELTEEHLLKVNNRYVPAKDVKVGDNLTDGGHGQATVMKVTSTFKAGLYAPLTPSGTLLVNGIQTSAYVSLQKEAKGNLVVGGWDTGISFHFLNHMALSPVRMTCLGGFLDFCVIGHIEKESGYPLLVSLWLDLVKWFDQLILPAQAFLLIAFFCIVGPIFTVETLAGSAFGCLLILLGVLVAVYHFCCFGKRTGLSSKMKQI